MRDGVLRMAGRAWRVASSLRTSCVLLVLLGLLTWLGTLAQVELGLHEAQRRYFESLVVRQPVGALAVWLPGGSLVLGALFLNLVCGGLLRLRRSVATLGVIVAHAGVLLLLVSAFITWRTAEEGTLTLREGEHASFIESAERYELVLREPLGPGRASERVIPQASFEDARGGNERSLASADLPFELVFRAYAAHAALAPFAGTWIEQPLPLEDQQRMPLVEVELRASGAASTPLAVWSASRAPVSAERGGRRFELELRRERRELPFALSLLEFDKQDYPGTGIPRSFASTVALQQGESSRTQRISMNEPLREGGWIVYQAGWGPPNAGPFTPLYSTFAVVRNPADQLPLVACLVIAAGLVLHFSRKLLAHLRSQSRERAAAPVSVVPRAARSPARAAAIWIALGLGAALHAQEWTPRALDVASELPLQEGGRIKPLASYARTTLLRLSGRETLKLRDGSRRDAVAWLLDTLVAPERAAHEPVFLVQHPAALESIGVARPSDDARVRMSFEELRPGLPKLMELAHGYAAIDAKERGAIEHELVRLAENAIAYGRVASALEFARASGPAGGRTLDETIELAADSGWLAVLAPAVPRAQDERWLAPLDVLVRARAAEITPPEHAAALAALGELAQSAQDPQRAERALEALAVQCRALADARGEGRSVGLELAYLRTGPLGYGLAAYLAALVALALSWLWPARRWLGRAAAAAAVAGTLLVIVAIAWRCAIRGRPPVTTLYETVLFVTAAGTACALVTEWIARRGVALVAAVALGVAGSFVARGYEVLDGRDTLPSLVAVLDTNFWLATHVTAITLGYAAGMLAALLGTLYVLGRLLPRRRADPQPDALDRERATARMVYGVICFGVIFTLVGTILGGIWANESWGRFWGWDPKENGALLIVLSQLALLHARAAGLLRERGVCVAAAAGGIVVAFSWWGVNLLGVGLHSYGFTSGIQRALWSYYAFQAAVVLLGVFALRKRSVSRSPMRSAEVAS